MKKENFIFKITLNLLITSIMLISITFTNNATYCQEHKPVDNAVNILFLASKNFGLNSYLMLDHSR